MYRRSPARPPILRLRAGGTVLASALALLALGGPGARAAKPTFGLDQVAERARELASRPYEDPRGQVPSWLLELSYDQWRQIRFRPEFAFWKDKKLPFTIQFFHPGLFYDRRVVIHEVDGAQVRPMAFSPEHFDYGVTEIASRVPQDLGYAGFRLHYPLKRPDYHDELIVFLGATYFRALGKSLGYGLSARGIAIDTSRSRNSYMRVPRSVTTQPIG